MSDYLSTDPALLLMAGGALPQVLPQASGVPAGELPALPAEFSRLLGELDPAAGAPQEVPPAGLLLPAPGPALRAETVAGTAPGQEAPRVPPGPLAEGLPGGNGLPLPGSPLPPPAATSSANAAAGDLPVPEPLPATGPRPASGMPFAAPGEPVAAGSGAGLARADRTAADTATGAGGMPAGGPSRAPEGAADEAKPPAAGQLPVAGGKSSLPLTNGEQRAAGAGIAELASGLRAQFGPRNPDGAVRQPEPAAATGSLALAAPWAGAPAGFSAAVQDPGAVLPPLALPQGASGLESWSRSLGSHLMVLAARGTTTAQLSLDPESLGPLRVTIELTEDQAQLRFSSPHAATREALESALPRLRELFADQGLQLVRAEVGSGEGEPDARQSAGDQAGRQPGWSAASAESPVTGRTAAHPPLAALPPAAGPARLLDTWA